MTRNPERSRCSTIRLATISAMISSANALAVLKAQSEREGAGVHYVAMRRIVENMGLDWSRQYRKPLEQKGKFSCGLMTPTGADGKTYEMSAMPFEELPLGLASINPNKIKSGAIRAKVGRYQAKSAESVCVALHELMVA